MEKMNYIEYLKEKYGKLTLTTEELATELSMSKRKVDDKVRECSAELPPFKKIGSTTLFPLNGVAEYLDNNFIEVM